MQAIPHSETNIRHLLLLRDKSALDGQHTKLGYFVAQAITIHNVAGSSQAMVLAHGGPTTIIANFGGDHDEEQ